jgi:hypothetical protein
MDKSRNPEIPCVIHHRHNLSEATERFLFEPVGKNLYGKAIPVTGSGDP